MGGPDCICSDWTQTAITTKEFEGQSIPVGALPTVSSELLEQLTVENLHYRHLDRSVLMAILAARRAFRTAGWSSLDGCGLSIGTSRGPAASQEKYFRAFLGSASREISPRTSPLTTFGNIASWVAQDLGISQAAFAHSSTCNSGLHAIINGMAWIAAGFCTRFLSGASEAPLTPYTLAQMRALSIYASPNDDEFPCRPQSTTQVNSFVLGEGAAVFALERFTEQPAHPPLALIDSFGTGVEKISSPTSISERADCIACSMRQALQTMSSQDPVDLVILHSPGTALGDAAELHAVHEVFGERQPYLISNKWLVGHTLAAAGTLNLDLALSILAGADVPTFPYPVVLEQKYPSQIRKIMVNSAGFGGNAASIIVSKAF